MSQTFNRGRDIFACNEILNCNIIKPYVIKSELAIGT